MLKTRRKISRNCMKLLRFIRSWSGEEFKTIILYLLTLGIFFPSISKLIQDCLIHVMYLNFFLLKCSVCGLAYQLSNVSRSLKNPQTLIFYFSLFVDAFQWRTHVLHETAYIDSSSFIRCIDSQFLWTICDLDEWRAFRSCLWVNVVWTGHGVQEGLIQDEIKFEIKGIFKMDLENFVIVRNSLTSPYR